ncbi:N-acetylglucosaminyl transferase component-domain-containing protein [Trametes punicea]|nr:N-acetylglucosaminyl transferase component-domain-containing protein [Trametes punicea]
MRATTVLWPSDLPSCSGICYGWKRPLILVAGVVPAEDEEDETVRALISSVASDPRWRGVHEMFTSCPTVIGFCVASASNSIPPVLRIKERSLHDDPSPDVLRCVLYRRHKRQSMRFYTFDFNELDILPSQESNGNSSPTSSRNAYALLDADFTRIQTSASRRGASLDAEVLSQANFARLLSDLVERRRAGDQLPGSRTPAAGTPDRPATPSTPPTVTVGEQRSRRTLVARVTRRLHAALRDLSTTVDQLDVRIEQAIYVAGEIPHVYHDKARTVSSISKYIKFHNCVWLVLNDVIIGIAFGTFLCENREILAAWLEYLMQYHLIHRTERALLWLNNWPAGLKLNTELSQFYCHTLIGMVSVWGWLLGRAAPYFPALIWTIGIAGSCGMTMIVSLLSDTLSLLTAHLYACYFISTAVFSQQLGLAGSLWNLFRGKRYNVLRNRIDTWDYDLDQLLLGTILFTLLAFLYPTVLTYYALFATARLAIMIVHAVLDTATALLNHFPLFALLLRVKDPLRLPGGVCIQRSKTGPLILTSQPAPLSSIFRHYAHLAGRLTTHYHPIRMLRQLAAGKLLTPIPRSAIRYNMIPVKKCVP